MDKKIVIKHLDVGASREQIISSFEKILKKQCLKAELYGILNVLAFTLVKKFRAKKSDCTTLICSLGIDDKKLRKLYKSLLVKSFLYRLSFRTCKSCSVSAEAIRSEIFDSIKAAYLYISSNGWEKLRRYDASKYPFANWFSVVSYRFFKDSVRSLIDSSSQMPINDMNDHDSTMPSGNVISTLMMDIKEILKKFKPPRDREILTAFLIYDEEPDTIAKRIGVTIDNLYNIKRRALDRLRRNYLIDYQI